MSIGGPHEVLPPHGAIEAAVATAMAPLVGPNRRGRALAAICRVWQESRDA